jgi:hypothetical protein
MRRFDVCNGDADGLCAVLQWRLAHPAPATLVTGLKRELALLHTVPAEAGDEVLVCDLSMQRNHAALLRLLDAGVSVRYVDHHKVDQVPQHAALQACIDTDARVCSSLLMDRLLDGRFRAWALVGAYGDNLGAVADALAAGLGLDAQERGQLRLLGEGINYNAYGDDASDQHIAPRALYARLAQHAHPLQLLRHDRIGSELDALRQRRPAAGAGPAGAGRGPRGALGVPARCRVGTACHRQLCQCAGGRRAGVCPCGAAGPPPGGPRRQPARAAGCERRCRRVLPPLRRGWARRRGRHRPAARQRTAALHRRIGGGALGWLSSPPRSAARSMRCADRWARS